MRQYRGLPRPDLGLPAGLHGGGRIGRAVRLPHRGALRAVEGFERQYRVRDGGALPVWAGRHRDLREIVVRRGTGGGLKNN